MDDVDVNPVLERIRGGLVVSCQAYPGEPMRRPDTMAQVAASVAAGGAAGVRAQGPDDIRAIRAVLDCPLIGLWKDGRTEVRITPTRTHAIAVAEAGADVVAVDATDRPRPDGRPLAETIRAVHEDTGRLVMADVSNYDEGLRAEELGADVVGTTLAGYVARRPAHRGPDLALVERLATRLTVPVLAEGRIRNPEQAAEALRRGAFAVVVGTAITHPTSLTEHFVAAMRDVDDRSV